MQFPKESNVKKYILVALLSLIPRFAEAQLPTLTGIKHDIYFTSDLTKIVASKSFPSTQFLCNQTPPVVSTIVINPTQFIWDDPTNVGKICSVTDKNLLDSLQPGDYVAKATFQYSDGSVGGTSNASNPFTRFIALIPQNLRIVR